MDINLQAEDVGATIFHLSDNEWKYRGEGNAHIAISIPAGKKIIRLPKCHSSDPQNNLYLWKKLASSITFIESIMKPLLGSEFISPPSLIYLSAEEIDILNKTLLPLRPENRLHKVLTFCGAELHVDHAFLPEEKPEFCSSKSVCIELKPKQGIFPQVEMQSRNCNFCCKQQLKLNDGLVSERSQYCPLELFSGYLPRMQQAIKSLILSPQNNLRIFFDGFCTFGDGYSVHDLETLLSEWLPFISGSNLFERFSLMLLQALTQKVDSPPVRSKSSAEIFLFDSLPLLGPKKEQLKLLCSSKDVCPILPRPPCNYEQQDLPEGCILYRLAQAQGLDRWGTAAVYDMLLESKDFLVKENGDSLESMTTYVHNIIQKGCTSKLNPIESYLIAAAVRDCSILITFQQIPWDCTKSCELPHVRDDASGTCYVFKATAVDIGPKPVSCISSHMNRNASILEACRKANRYC